jgi:hypothetical protein
MVLKKNWIGNAVLAVWLVAMLFGLAALSLQHMASLPEPNDALMLRQAMLATRHSSHGNFLLHVIYGPCSCSRALFAHLLARRPFPGAEEAILFVGADDDPRKAASAQRAGFSFTVISAQELTSRFGLEAAPILAILDSAGMLRYAGGYYAHPATITPLDERIYTGVVAGAKVAPLPIFGCAVSLPLQKALNPFSALTTPKGP